MMIAVFNNLPELFLGGCWTVTVFLLGSRFGSWKTRRKANA